MTTQLVTHALRRFALALAAACAVAPVAAEVLPVTPEQARALGIDVAAPVASSASALSRLPAHVTVPPAQQSVIAAPLAGLVSSVLVSGNESVRAGQPLLRLESPGLVEAQRGLLSAAVQEDLARRNLARDEALHAEGIIAESRLLASRGQHVQAAAALAEQRQLLRLAGMPEAALARLRATRQLSAALTVDAPSAGSVLEVLVSPGQRVEAAAPLLRLARLSPLWLEVQVPVAHAAEVRVGAAVSVPLAKARGRVLSLGGVVHPENQTVMVRAEIGGGEGLRPGQFVEAEVATQASAPAWRLPMGALARAGDRSVVFVQTRGGFRPVQAAVLREDAEGVLLAAPLAPGDRVAVRGVAALKAQLATGGR